MRSCVYRGHVSHRRLTPVPHAFRYPLFMMYLDLAELPGALDGRWLWSARRPALAWFRRADYLGDPEIPLARAVADLVARRTGRRPGGPVRLLTHLRTFGYVQNPVSFYYCFDVEDRRVETIVAEITNTPWGERHAYVVPAGGARRPSRFDKEFHVSPFMPMDQGYAWRFTRPGSRLAVQMQSSRHGRVVFEATLRLKRQPLNGPVLAACLARHPWMTASVAGRIYWQAFRLWWKGAPFHAHPSKRRRDVPALPAR